MAPHLDITINEALIAFNSSFRGYNAFGKQCQCLCRFDGRAWGLWFADGLPDIISIRRIGGKAKYFSVSRVNGHDTSRFSL